MRKFTIYFEIYGKRMKTTIYANTEAEAQEKVRNSITFYDIRNKTQEEDSTLEFLRQTFNMK